MSISNINGDLGIMANKDFGLTKAGTKRKREAREDEGRPSVYEERFLLNKEGQQKALESYNEGGADVHAALIFGIDSGTLLDWLGDKDKKEFCQFIKKGRDLSLKWYLDEGKDNFGNKDFNNTAFIFIAKNIHRRVLGEKSEVNHNHKGKIDVPVVHTTYISMSEHKKEMKLVEESKNEE